MYSVNMVLTVLHGSLSEAEQDAYIRQATEKYPISIIEKLILDVQGDHVTVSCILHRFRDLRKMGGLLYRGTVQLELRKASGIAGHDPQSN